MLENGIYMKFKWSKHSLRLSPFPPILPLVNPPSLLPRQPPTFPKTQKAALAVAASPQAPKPASALGLPSLSFSPYSSSSFSSAANGAPLHPQCSHTKGLIPRNYYHNYPLHRNKLFGFTITSQMYVQSLAVQC